MAARSAKLPYLDAYLNPERSFYGGCGGVNFAVAGSTALPVEALLLKNMMNIVTKESLSTQLEWMSTYFNTCSKGNRCVSYDVSIVKSFFTIMPNSYCFPDCAKEIKSSLFMVGEIGGNDYNYAFLFHKTTEEMKALVPEVIKAIKHAVVVCSFSICSFWIPCYFVFVYECSSI